jgi:hypothetical protein
MASRSGSSTRRDDPQAKIGSPRDADDDADQEEDEGNEEEEDMDEDGEDEAPTAPRPDAGKTRGDKAHVAQPDKIIDREPQKADEKAVAEHVEKIRGIVEKTSDLGFQLLGEYVFKHVFGGDPDRVHSKSQSKNATFSSLAERCQAEFHITKTWLHEAVRAAAIRSALPEHCAFKQLPASSQGEVARLNDPKKADEVAQRVLDEKLKYVEVREVVAKEMPKPKAAGKGRRRKPTFVKSLAILEKRYVQSDKLSFIEPQIREMKISDAAKAAARVKDLLSILKKLYVALKPRSEEREEPRKPTKAKGAKPKSSNTAAQSKAAPTDTCSRSGCGKGWYRPSGKEKKLCYTHFIAAGGKAPTGPKKGKTKGASARGKELPRRTKLTPKKKG